jgi:hypothetical protein
MFVYQYTYIYIYIYISFELYVNLVLVMFGVMLQIPNVFQELQKSIG